MNAPINVQIIHDAEGKPSFVVIPYEEYVAQQNRTDEALIPHEVISRCVDGYTPARAWREYLKLTQAEIAERLGISQSAYAQQEKNIRPRKRTLKRLAAALGVSVSQLDV